MTRKSILISAVILFLLPLVSFAEGLVTAVKGTALVKKAGQEWHILKEGETLDEGTTIWIGASSFIVFKVNNELAELSGGSEGQDVTIVRLSPLEVSGKGIEVKTNGSPAAPTFLFPEDKFRSVDGKMDLSWSPSGRETLYHIQISARPGFDKIIIDEKSYNTEKRIEVLEAGGFYWRVSAINKEGLEGKFSESRSFVVRPIPEPPSLNPPASTKTSTTFRWKRRSEEERYHLQISKNKDFSETDVDLKYIEGPRVTVGTLEEGDYFARVSAIDEDGLEGRFSEPQSFYVGPKVPSSNIGPLMIMFGVAFMLLGIP